MSVYVQSLKGSRIFNWLNDHLFTAPFRQPHAHNIFIGRGKV